MLSALEKFGPGRQFFWGDHRIALGGNLSSFLPEDRFDNQPLWSSDRSTCLVADVRLDNRADLARELGLVHPEELADSAFLMAAWLRWGPACLDHILGGFAFAVWTPGRQELFAARDHAGDCPLYYHRGERLFALASMPGGLLALPGFPRQFKRSELVDWLESISSNWNSTYFEGIERLPPGHFVRVTPASFERRQYWHPSNAKPTRYLRNQDYEEALVEILDRATEARLRSTGPIGSHLSAGLDSSSVTASAARLQAARGQRLTAFTAVPRPEFNGIVQSCHLPSEAEGAADVARLYPNIDHLLVNSQGYDVYAIMKAWVDALDEPAPNVTNLPWATAILDQAKQRGIRVLLTGAMGNLTISWNSWSILGYLFRHGRLIELARTTRALHRHGAISLKTAARSATHGLVPRWLVRRLISQKNVDGLYECLANPAGRDRRKLEAKIFEAIYNRPPNPMRDRSELFEFRDTAPPDAAILALSGIEMRDPTADKRVFDFCFSIPFEQYLAEGHPRSLVRRAMKHRLPQSTLMRYTRGQQGSDWYLHMEESLPDLRTEVQLLARCPAASEALDLPAIEHLLNHWPQSDFHLHKVNLRWEYWLTLAISLGYFLRTHESPTTPPPVPAPALSTAPLR